MIKNDKAPPAANVASTTTTVKLAYSDADRDA